MALNVAMAHKIDTVKHRFSGLEASQDEKPEVTHEELLERVGRDRDQEAFVEIFEYFAPRIKSFLMKGGCASDQADELAQEAMLSVWHKADSYDSSQAKASTWMFTIARNKKIDAFRKMKKIEVDIDDYHLTDNKSPMPSEAAFLKEETRTLKESIDKLPKEQAELIRKSFFEDKSHAEIAAETKIPLGTIKSRIRLGLERLRGEQKIGELWN